MKRLNDETQKKLIDAYSDLLIKCDADIKPFSIRQADFYIEERKRLVWNTVFLTPFDMDIKAEDVYKIAQVYAYFKELNPLEIYLQGNPATYQWLFEIISTKMPTVPIPADIADKIQPMDDGDDFFADQDNR